MATVSDRVINIYGNIDYTDGSKDEFFAQYEHGIYIGPDPQSAPSTDGFQQLVANTPTDIAAFFALLPGTHTFKLSPSSSPKTLADYSLNYYGVIAYSDNTISTFGVTKSKKAGMFSRGKTSGTLYQTVGSTIALSGSDTNGIQEDGSGGGQNITTGQVLINSVDIVAAGGLSLTSSSGANLNGAKDIAARIAKYVSGVGASATTTLTASSISTSDTAAGTAGGTIVAGTTDTGSNKLTINGTAIAGAKVTAGDGTGTLTAAINAAQSTTGVFASVSNSVLTLTAADGRDIVVSTTGVAGNVAFGLGSSKNCTNLRCRGVLTLHSKSPITITGTAKARAGLNAVTSTTPTLNGTLDYLDLLLDPTSLTVVNQVFTNLGGASVSIQS